MTIFAKNIIMDFEEIREKTLWAVRLRQHKSPTSGRWREIESALGLKLIN